MQVLSNLIGNAIKFTEEGKIQVSVDKVEDKANKMKLMFSIKDTGIGIKEEDIPRLFNYFTQLDISASKKFQGTGLGLAISKNIVELMEEKYLLKVSMVKEVPSTLLVCLILLVIVRNHQIFKKYV